MSALLKAILLACLVLVPQAFAGKLSDFEKAYGQAADSVGTDQFASSVAMATSMCTRKEYECVSRLAKLRELDRLQRQDDARKPAVAKAPVETVAPEPEPEADDEDYGFYEPPAFVVDQPTGLEDVASYSRPPAPWSGVEVEYIKESFPEMALVCLKKDGIDLPMGPNVPFSDSNEKGSPVQGCHAARVESGQSIWVPEGTTLQIGVYNGSRQVYVVEHVYTCYKSPASSGLVYQNVVVACNRVR